MDRVKVELIECGNIVIGAWHVDRVIETCWIDVTSDEHLKALHDFLNSANLVWRLQEASNATTPSPSSLVKIADRGALNCHISTKVTLNKISKGTHKLRVEFPGPIGPCQYFIDVE